MRHYNNLKFAFGETGGLTKREFFTAVAMLGLLRDSEISLGTIKSRSVAIAEEVLDELEKPSKKVKVKKEKPEKVIVDWLHSHPLIFGDLDIVLRYLSYKGISISKDLISSVYFVDKEKRLYSFEDFIKWFNNLFSSIYYLYNKNVK